MTVELKPHQQKAVDELGNGKILYGDVGVGKTFTAMAYYISKVCKGTYGDYYTMRTPKDIYVITTALVRDKRDWENAAIQFKVSPVREYSIDGVKITVDSWNNINKYIGVKDAFFVFDEQRLVGSGTWTKSFIKIAKLNEWILLSATPGDTWLDYIPVFIANGFYKNRTEFKDRHVVYKTYGKFPKVDRYLEPGTLVRHRNSLLVHMPYPRHTTRHIEIVDVDYNKFLFDKVMKKRWHVFEMRPLRDVAELFVVMRKVVNLDESRITSVRSLMQKHPRLIVFYNFDYELEMLRTLANTHPGQDSLSSTDHPRMSSMTQMPGNEQTHRSFSTTTMLSSSSYDFEETQQRLSSEKRLKKSSPQEKSSNLSLVPSLTSNGLKSSSSETVPTVSSIGIEFSDSKSTEKPITQTTSSSSFTIAEWNGHKHDPLPETERWVYLVQYQAGAEGWNCITTNAVCFYSLTYSYKLWHQAHGRIDRLNTPYEHLYYYVLRSKSMIDLAIWKALKGKRSFNESAYKVDLAA